MPGSAQLPLALSIGLSCGALAALWLVTRSLRKHIERLEHKARRQAQLKEKMQAQLTEFATKEQQHLSEKAVRKTAERVFWDNIPTFSYIPYDAGQQNYIVHQAEESQNLEYCEQGMPVPPTRIWLRYATTTEEYLAGGKRDVATMLRLIEQSGRPLPEKPTVLEFGCASGRMIRWLVQHRPGGEFWGCDLWGEPITWCKIHLSKWIHFMTTTIYPHLPFEDNSLDLVFAGSVFSHSDDLANAWLMEIRRILKPQGRAFITIQDENSIAHLKEHKWWLSEQLYATADYPRYIEENFAMFAIGRHAESQVFYNQQYFAEMINPFFEVVSVTPHAYGNQTGVLLEKRAKQS